jgi:putative hydrolase of the HAD superfamily
MNKFKAVGFDYAGVIYGKPSSIFDDGISKLLDISIKEFKISYHKFSELYNKHSVSREELWKMVLKDLGKEGMTTEVFEYFKNLPEPKINNEVLLLVEKLKSMGYKVGLFSNNSKQAAEEMRREGIDKHFDVFLVSAEAGCVKPSFEAFKMLAEKLGVRLSELVFIDDTANSLSLSGVIGFQPILFKDYNSLVKELILLGIVDLVIKK